MKIAFLNLYSGVNFRGAEAFAHELALRLAKSHEVTFYTGGKLELDGVMLRNISTRIAQPVHRRNFLKPIFLDGASLSVLVFTLKAFKFLWDNKYDWIVPMDGFWQLLLCKIIVTFRGGRILVTGHSGPGWDERWNLYLKPNIFVATTAPTGQWARKTCFWTKVVVIPYGIDMTKFATAKNKRLDLERPIILCPAAAVPYKRIDLAIKAVARLKQGSLLHLGSGPLAGEITKLGEEMLGKKRFASLVVSPTEMPSYYRAVDLVTLPSSRQENSPMVFLEAMAADKFTVTTDSPRSRWILGKAGYFVDPEQTGGYARILESALAARDRRLTKLEADRFSWNKILIDYERIFNEK